MSWYFKWSVLYLFQTIGENFRLIGTLEGTFSKEGAFFCSWTQTAFLQKEKRWNTNWLQRKRKPGLKIVFSIFRLCVHLLPPEVKGGDVDKVVLPSPTCRTCPTCQACSACPACCPPLSLDALLGPHHFTLESGFEWLSNSSVKSLWVTDLCHRFYRTESELAPKLVTR